MISVVIPLRTGLGLNSREHWSARARRTKRERQAVALVLGPHIARLEPYPPGEAKIVITRIKPVGKPLDFDNLHGALKAVRDAIAKCLGIDDGSPRLAWGYCQEKGDWGVRIEIRY